MQPPAVILAQGTSRRMGRDKGLVRLGGRPLIAHVVERLAPQCGALAINGPAAFGAAALSVDATLIDEAPFAGKGPLGGIRAGLVWARTATPLASHLLIVPVDMPFLPADLVERLRGGLAPHGAAIAMSPDGRIVPVLGLWPLSALEPVEQVLRGGNTLAVHAVLDLIEWRGVEFSAEALADIDDPAALAAAEAWAEAWAEARIAAAPPRP